MQLWCWRNDKERDNIVRPVWLSVLVTNEYLHDWQMARRKQDSNNFSSRQEHIMQTQEKQGSRKLKCNIDAVIFSQRRQYGISI